MAAFFAMAAATFLWLIPWLPIGLDASDYSPELAFTVYLLGGLVITGILALAAREFVRRQREGLLVWTKVYDETTGLHSREYLYDRISLECERAEHAGSVFSVLLLQVRFGASASGQGSPPSGVSLRRVAEVVNRARRPTDLVGFISDREVAIFATGVNKEDRRSLQTRLATTMGTELARALHGQATVELVSGGATYGLDGRTAPTLIQAARAEAVLATPECLSAA
ncbi:MAG: diguanylate cyclase [Chloroflexi bacterium]|nr:diguanylate cyclase [Chloroflexota bacterium]